MSQGHNNKTVVTVDEQPEAGRVIDAGRKGGMVSSAPYSEAGPLAGRMYDATAALSEQANLLRVFVPVLVFAVVTAVLFFAALRYQPRETPQGNGQIAPSASNPGSGARDRGMRSVHVER